MELLGHMQAVSQTWLVSEQKLYRDDGMEIVTRTPKYFGIVLLKIEL